MYELLYINIVEHLIHYSYTVVYRNFIIRHPLLQILVLSHIKFYALLFAINAASCEFFSNTLFCTDIYFYSKFSKQCFSHFTYYRHSQYFVFQETIFLTSVLDLVSTFVNLSLVTEGFSIFSQFSLSSKLCNVIAFSRIFIFCRTECITCRKFTLDILRLHFVFTAGNLPSYIVCNMIYIISHIFSLVRYIIFSDFLLIVPLFHDKKLKQ